jgi:hypothetical protein
VAVRIFSVHSSSGTFVRLEDILREVGVAINIDNIPTDDEPDVIPESEPIHFIDTY